MHRRQLTVFLILLLLAALSAFVIHTLFSEELAASAGVPVPDMGVPESVLGLANAGIVIAQSGILGLVGYWFARRLALPGIYSEDGNWGRWFFIPLVLGLMCGILLIIGDLVFAPINGFGRFVHPEFPISIPASLNAGIGEEITFRGFVLGLWGVIFDWLSRRFKGRRVALWIANILSALAFGAGHLMTLLFLTGASSLAELNPILVTELFLLNGILGLVAGWRYMKDGLVAAAGVHFWNDVAFHVLWGLV